MEFSVPLAALLAVSMLGTFCFTSTNAAVDGLDTAATTTFTSPPPPPSTSFAPPPQDLEHSFLSHTNLLVPILTQLGFHELATAVPSLAAESATTTTNSWTGPSTLFAPSDASLHSCFSCSVPSLLREHMVPGLFSIDYLRRLQFGTKIETLSPGRCITVTSDHSRNDTVSSKIFIGGMEITHPDLYNNGLVVVHGLQGFVSPLSPFSCDVERMTSLSFPFQPDHRSHGQMQSSTVQPAIMRMMLRDAMLRLRNSGFSILSLAMKVKYSELMTLNNMTVFTVDDVSIFTGSYSYITSVRFHIVPNHFLTIGDLERLPMGTTLPTLERGQSLVVTTAGNVGFSAAPMRINYVRVKVPDVMRNLKIVVHSLFLPFPHFHPSAAIADGVVGGGAGAKSGGTFVSGGVHTVPAPDRGAEEACSASDEFGSVGCAAAVGISPVPLVKATVEIEDHHGL